VLPVRQARQARPGRERERESDLPEREAQSDPPVRCSRVVVSAGAGAGLFWLQSDQESRGCKRSKYFQRLHCGNSYAGEMEMPYSGLESLE